MHTFVQQQELRRLRVLWMIQRMARSLETFRFTSQIWV